MNRKTTMFGLVLALCCCCLAPALAGDEKPRAMDFTFEDINPASPTHGKQLSLNELYAGRGVVLNFLASWCGYCWKELPILQQLHDDEKAFVVGMAADEADAPGQIERLLVMVRRAGLTIPILHVPADKLSGMESFYDYEILPATYLIDKEGMVRQVLQGKVPAEALEAEIGRNLGS